MAYIDPYILMSVDRYAAAGMKIPCLVEAYIDLKGTAGDGARALGMEVGSALGNIYTAFLPADKDLIEKIAAIPGINSFEASR
jgi:hypothetical protein